MEAVVYYSSLGELRPFDGISPALFSLAYPGDLYGTSHRPLPPIVLNSLPSSPWIIGVVNP
ncbi:hypothetical protein E2C01_074492 [Portunus trituberculatus]|uniref:Uncharacterized protein n=1 Tax=Portunus trituberculatus TaxID=210409 RepID=A0A5B7IHD9_PORTR|nr:hypothetical protein [Portunus trituberculatus]